MRQDKKKKTYSLTPRDLAVMHEAKVGFNEITSVNPKYAGLPPLWSRLPYLMLLHNEQKTSKYFWKEYREFDQLLTTRDSHYRRSRIPKNSGGTRELLVPDWDMRHHQRFIQKNILYKIPVSEHACAYHKRRGLTDLARPHIGHNTLIHLDIKDFFTSITEQMVFFSLLRETGYPKSVCGFLSRLCCYKRYLPQGACTSPALSNICFKLCDEELAAFASQNNLSYSRYSDDIYFSGDNVKAKFVIAEVKSLLARHGFYLRSDKTKVLGKHQAQKVTAIVVNEKMQVSREYRRKLRQDIYYLKKYGEQSTGALAADDYDEYLYQLLGRVSFVLYVDPNNKEFLEKKDMIDEILYGRRYYRLPF